MAKRRRRRSAPRKSGQTRSAQMTRRVAEARPSSGEPDIAGRAPQSVSKEADFASEYRYVLGDLKRIAILAAGMFATLVVLALVIR